MHLVEDETADRVYVPGTKPTPAARDVEPFWPPEELEAPVHGGKPVPHEAPPAIPMPGVYRPGDRGPVPPPSSVAGRPPATAPEPAVPATPRPASVAAARPVSGASTPNGSAGSEPTGPPDSPWAQPPNRPHPAEGYDDVDIQELGSRNRIRPAPSADTGVTVTSERLAYYPTVSPRRSTPDSEQAGGNVYRPGPVPPEPARPAAATAPPAQASAAPRPAESGAAQGGQ